MYVCGHAQQQHAAGRWHGSNQHCASIAKLQHHARVQHIEHVQLGRADVGEWGRRRGAAAAAAGAAAAGRHAQGGGMAMVCGIGMRTVWLRRFFRKRAGFTVYVFGSYFSVHKYLYRKLSVNPGPKRCPPNATEPGRPAPSGAAAVRALPPPRRSYAACVFPSHAPPPRACHCSSAHCCWHCCCIAACQATTRARAALPAAGGPCPLHPPLLLCARHATTAD